LFVGAWILLTTGVIGSFSLGILISAFNVGGSDFICDVGINNPEK
jgi:hypothetical protein